MKKVQLFVFVLFTALTISCSSDDNGGDSAGLGEFTLTSSGVALDVEMSQAVRSEDSFLISATTTNGLALEMEFDKFGNFGGVNLYDLTGANNDIDRMSYFNFRGNYFNFDLVTLDESGKKVKVNYSGKVYDDEDDLQSEFTEISGSFYLNYTDVTSQLPEDSKGFSVSAKISGNDWYAVDGFETNGESFYDVVLHNVSDDEYKIMINYNEEDVIEGVYTFTQASTVNRVQLAKFDTATKLYTVYNVAGTLTITEIADAGFVRTIKGTFSFTATNPDNSADVIQVTEGKFKEIL